MRSNDAILVALLVLLVIIVAYQGGSWARARGACDGFTVADASAFSDGRYNPYAVLNKQLDDIRGVRNDGFNQPPIWSQPQGLDRYHRAGADLTPEAYAEAERQNWYGAIDADEAGPYNTELAHDHSADTFYNPSPPIDYNAMITDLVTDSRTRENHRRWAEEMKPWSGTARKVDDLDLEPYVDFTGLRRPQAVVQFNPWVLTEVGPEDLAVNPPFRFKG